MNEERATRWRCMSREQRERLMSVVASIQTSLDALAGDVLAEVLRLEYSDFLHPQDHQALRREQHRRAEEKRHG